MEDEKYLIVLGDEKGVYDKADVDAHYDELKDAGAKIYRGKGTGTYTVHVGDQSDDSWTKDDIDYGFGNLQARYKDATYEPNYEWDTEEYSPNAPKTPAAPQGGYKVAAGGYTDPNAPEEEYPAGRPVQAPLEEAAPEGEGPALPQWQADIMSQEVAKMQRRTDAIGSQFDSDEERLAKDMDLAGDLSDAVARLEKGKRTSRREGDTEMKRAYKSAAAERQAQLDEVLARIDQNPAYAQELEAESKSVEEKQRDLENLPIVADLTRQMQNGAQVQYNPDYLNYAAASRLYEDALQTINAPLEFAEREKGDKLREYGKGMVDDMKNPDFWSLGLTNIEDKTAVRSSLQALENLAGKITKKEIDNLDELDLTDTQKAVIDAYFTAQAANVLRALDTSHSYTSGMQGAETLKFFAEMAMTGGLGRAASKAVVEKFAPIFARKLVQMAPKTLAGAAGKWALRQGTKLTLGQAKALAGMGAMTLAQPITYENIAERATQIDEFGKLVPLRKAFLEGGVDEGIEVFTELRGELPGNILGAVLDGTSRVLGLTPGGKKLVSALRNSSARMLGGKARMLMRGSKGLVGIGWDNAGEVFEELEGAAIRDITGLQPGAVDEFFKVQNLLDMTATFAPMAAIGLVTGTANVGRSMYYANKLKGVEQNLRAIVGDGNMTDKGLDRFFNKYYRWMDSRVGEEDRRAGGKMGYESAENLTAQDMASDFMTLYKEKAQDMTPDERGQLLKSMTDYMKTFQQAQVIKGAQEAEEDAEGAAAMEQQIQNVGRDFTYKGKTDFAGNQVVVGQLITNQNADGTATMTAPVYIVGDLTATGEYPVVYPDGKTGFVKADNLYGTDTYAPGEYGKDLAMQQKSVNEEQRMSAETEGQVAGLMDSFEQRYPVGAQANELLENAYQMNGETVPEWIYDGDVYVESANEQGVTFMNENGASVNMTWEELAPALGGSIEVKSDDDIANEEAGRLSAEDDARTDIASRIEQAVSNGIFLEQTGEQIVGIIKDSINLQDGTAKATLRDRDGNERVTTINYAEILGKMQQPAAQEAAAEVSPQAAEAPAAPAEAPAEKPAETPAEPAYQTPMKDGEVDWDKMLEENPSEFARQFDELNGGDTTATREVLEARVKELQDKKKKLKPTAVNDRVKLDRQIKAAQDVLDKYARAEETQKARKELDAIPTDDAQIVEGRTFAQTKKYVADSLKKLDELEKENPEMADEIAAKRASLAELSDIIGTVEEDLPAIGATEAEEADLEPRTPLELAAWMFANGKLKITHDAFAKETGLRGKNGKGMSREAKNFLKMLSKNGLTIEAAGERLEEAVRERQGAVTPLPDEVNAGRDTILELFSMVNTFGDFKNFIKTERRAEAEKEANAQMRMIAEDVKRATGLDVQTYLENLDALRMNLLRQLLGLPTENINFEQKETQEDERKGNGEAAVREGVQADGRDAGPEGPEEESADTGAGEEVLPEGNSGVSLAGESEGAGERGSSGDDVVLPASGEAESVAEDLPEEEEAPTVEGIFAEADEQEKPGIVTYNGVEYVTGGLTGEDMAELWENKDATKDVDKGKPGRVNITQAIFDANPKINTFENEGQQLIAIENVYQLARQYPDLAISKEILSRVKETPAIEQKPAEKEQKPVEKTSEKPSESPKESVSSQKEEAPAESAEPVAPQQLTEEQIRNSGYADENTIENAVDYINGDNSFQAKVAYKIIEDYVRSNAQTTQASGRSADQTQLPGEGAENVTEQAGRGGVETVPVVPEPDGGRGREDNPQQNSAVLPGERGADVVPGAQSGPDADNSGNRVRGGRGVSGANGQQRNDVGGQPESGSLFDGADQGRESQPAPRNTDAGSLDEAALGAELTDLLGQLDDILPSISRDKLQTVDDILGAVVHYEMAPKTAPTTTDAPLSSKRQQKIPAPLSLEGMEPGKAILLGKIMFSAAKAGYAHAVNSTETSYRDFSRWFKQNFGKIVSEKLGEESVEPLILAAWDTKLKIHDTRLTLAEYVDNMHNLELRTNDDYAAKQRAQEAVNKDKGPIKIADRDDIKKTLPALQPGQWDDVTMTERQFFDKSHDDYDHAYGKGMLITNGTGTGKTYTGMGVIKRFVRQGKKRILLVTPANMVDDWEKTAKKFDVKLNRLENTKDRGEGVIITSYENFRSNKELYKDTFDLVVYDEAQKIIYGQAADETLAYIAHRRITNKNVDEATDRLVYTTPVGQQKLALEQEKDKLEREAKKKTVTSDRSHEIIIRQREIDEELKGINQQVELLKPSLRKQAEEDVKKTKVLMLSASPFNTVGNLKFAEGYIFNYPKVFRANGTENTSEKARKAQFDAEWFGGDNSEQDEIEFADHLIDELETVQFRELENGYDHSRDFPDVSGMVMADRFNQAWEAVNNNASFAPLKSHSKFMTDYAWTSQLFEVMKVSALRPRIQEHLDAGRKIVLFHNRLHDTKIKDDEGNLRLPPVGPPFTTLLAQAQDDTNATMATILFQQQFKDVLKWEQSLDYRPVPDQMIDLFATDADRAKYEKEMAAYNKERAKWEKETEEAVAKGQEPKPAPKEPKLQAESICLFNGELTEKQKTESKDAFNNDDSKKKIIIVTTASGGAGLSLHDTTGKHQRVMIQTSLPNSPIGFIQAEGRIFRFGNKSNAVFEYPRLGLNLEAYVFAMNFNKKVGTTENLAHGTRGRGFKDSIMTGFYENSGIVPLAGQGIGGVELDKRGSTLKDMAKALHDYEVSQRKGITPDDGAVPEPVGFKMAQWSKVEAGEKVIVPYAGRGSIPRYIPAGVDILALEDNTALQTKMAVTAGREELNIKETGFDVLHSGANKADALFIQGNTRDEAMNSIQAFIKGFQHINEGGRLIAILPDTKETDAAIDNLGPASAQRLSVKVAPGIFGPDATRLVMVDRITDPKLRAKATKSEIDLSNVTDQTEFFQSIDKIEAPERIIDKKAVAVRKLNSLATQIKQSPFVDSMEVEARGWVGINYKTKKGFKCSKKKLSDFTRGRGIAYRGNWDSYYLSNFENPTQDNKYVYAYTSIKEILQGDDEELRDYCGFDADVKEETIVEFRALLNNYLKFIRAAFGLNDSQMMRVAAGMQADVSAADIKSINSLTELREKFQAAVGDDEEYTQMFDDVVAVSEKAGVKVTTFYEENGFVGLYGTTTNELKLNALQWNRIKDSERAATCLHELIHSATSYAIEAADVGVSGMSDALYNSAKSVITIFDQLQRGAPEHVRPIMGYALQNPHELMAEMANPEIREKLKARPMWTRETPRGTIVSGEQREGFEETTAWDLLNLALHDILNNYDKALFERFLNRKGTFFSIDRKRVTRECDGGYHYSYGENAKPGIEAERNEVENAANTLGASMHINVVFEDSAPAHARNIKGKMVEPMGWYDTFDSSIHLNMARIKNVEQAESTVLHEAVGHYGLRALFGKDFNEFLDEVYNGATQGIRDTIDAIGKDRGLNKRDATEEYLSMLAEEGFSDKEERSFWQKVKDWFMDMLHKAGALFTTNLTDADLRYILWESKRNLEQGDVLQNAENAINRAQLRGEAESSHEELTNSLDRRPGESEKEFVDRFKADFESRYNPIVPIETSEEQNDGLAEYDPNTKKITIFALDGVDSHMDLEDSAFHEIFHAFVDELPRQGRRGFVKEFLDGIRGLINPEDLAGMEDNIAKEYEEKDRDEELAANLFASMLESGNAVDAIPEFNEYVRNNINNLLNRLGYDPEREAESRQEAYLEAYEQRDKVRDSEEKKGNGGAGSGSGESEAADSYRAERVLPDGGRTKGLQENPQGASGVQGERRAAPSGAGYGEESARGAVDDSLYSFGDSKEYRDRISKPTRVSRALRDIHTTNEMWNTARHFYEMMVNTPEFLMKEQYQNMYESVRVLMQALEKETGRKAQDFENFDLVSSAVPSKNKQDHQTFGEKYLDPMNKAIADLTKIDGVDYDDVVKYVELKHGLERNKEMARRSAMTDYEDAYTKKSQQLISENKSLRKQMEKMTENVSYDGMTAKEKAKYDELARQVKDNDKKLQELTDELQEHRRVLYPKEYYRDRHDATVKAIKADPSLTHAEKMQYIEAENQNFAARMADIDNNPRKYEAIREKDPRYAHYRGTDGEENNLGTDYAAIRSWFSEYQDADGNPLTETPVRLATETKAEYNGRLRRMRHVMKGAEAITGAEEMAQQWIDEFEDRVGKEGYDNLWNTVNAATNWILKHQLDNHSIGREQYEALKDRFKYYVPLRGFAEETAEDMWNYGQEDHSGDFAAPLLPMQGRRSKPAAPFSQIATMADTAIVQDNRNSLRRALYRFVANRPDNSLVTIADSWYENTHQKDADGNELWAPVYPSYTPGMSQDDMRAVKDAFEEEMKEKAAAGDAILGSKGLNLRGAVSHIDSENRDKHLVKVRMFGKEHFLIVNGNPRAALALNGQLNIESLSNNALLRVFRDVTRIMSMANTGLSPSFWFANFAKDFLTGTFNTAINEDAGYLAKFEKNYALAVSMLPIILREGKFTDNPNWTDKTRARMKKNTDLYSMYLKHGGPTGFTTISNIEQYESLIRSAAKKNKSHAVEKIQKLWNGITQVGRIGEALEQVPRFAAFLTSMEEGRSIERSIRDAKDVTLDFNTKGAASGVSREQVKQLQKITKDGAIRNLTALERAYYLGILNLAPSARSLIMFFNPAVQGVEKMIRNFKGNPKKAAAVTGGLVMAGIARAILAALFPPDDDNTYSYNDLNEYRKRSNFVIPVGPIDILWPISQEFAPFYALGDIIAGTMLKRNGPTDKPVMEAMNTLGSLLPINPFSPEEFVPDLLSPILEVYRNRNFMGSYIYYDYASNKDLPNYTKAPESTWGWLVDASQRLNELTGGDYARKGAVDINPAVVQHLAEGIGGGILRDLGNLTQEVEDITKGNDLKLRNTMVLRRFALDPSEYRNAYVYDQYSQYYNAAQEAKRLHNKYKDDLVRQIELEDSKEWQYYQIFKDYYEDEIKALRKERDEATDARERAEATAQLDAVMGEFVEECSEIFHEKGKLLSRKQ